MSDYSPAWPTSSYKVFPPRRQDMVLSSEATTERTRFGGPAWVGLGSLFAADVPECTKCLVTVDAASECTLWRVHADTLRRLALQHSPDVMLHLARVFQSSAVAQEAALAAAPLERRGRGHAVGLASAQGIVQGMAALTWRLDEAAAARAKLREQELAELQTRGSWRPGMLIKRMKDGDSRISSLEGSRELSRVAVDRDGAAPAGSPEQQEQQQQEQQEQQQQEQQEQQQRAVLFDVFVGTSQTEGH